MLLLNHSFEIIVISKNVTSLDDEAKLKKNTKQKQKKPNALENA